MATIKGRAAKNSRVQVNGTNLNFGDFDVTDQADRLDTTNFESGGVGQVTIGVEWCTVDFGGLWDAHVNYLDSPPGLFPQDSLASVKLFPSQSDNTFWLFTLFCVLSAKNGAHVRDRVMFSVSGESNGAFTRPTGSV